MVHCIGNICSGISGGISLIFAWVVVRQRDAPFSITEGCFLVVVPSAAQVQLRPHGVKILNEGVSSLERFGAGICGLTWILRARGLGHENQLGRLICPVLRETLPRIWGVVLG